MNKNNLLYAFRAFLILWIGMIIAHFLYVQLKTDFGKIDVPWDKDNLWHPYYFGVVNATLVIVPSIFFHVPTMLRYGGLSSAIGRSILLISLGVSFWGLGNFYWFSKNVSGASAPYPSWADAGYLAVLPFAAAGLWQMSKVIGTTKNDWKWLPLAFLAAVPVNLYIMLPQGIGAGTFDSKKTTIISSTYIASDVILLGAAIVIALVAKRSAGARFFPPIITFTVALLALYIGDIFFNYRIAKDIFYNGEISDLFYGVFIVLSSVSMYLFLRADVLASESVSDDSSSSTIDISELEKAGLSVSDQIATSILWGQIPMLGESTSRTIIGNVNGIIVDERGYVHVGNDSDLDLIVKEFVQIAGPLGEMTCWTSARNIVRQHPELRIDSFTRFMQ